MNTTIINPINTRPRDVQTHTLNLNTKVFRSRTWERLKFEVEYGLEKGTTANSYLIQGDKTALIDPPGESFTDIFLTELERHIDLNKLDYLILSHVNPNRMVTLNTLLEKAPDLSLICSKPAAKALTTAFPHWSNKIHLVRSEDTLDLGQGHELKFLFLPTPRWPDGICTYDPQTRILYSDKLFGVHLCGDELFDEDWKQLDIDRHYYFNCLHASQAKQVENILDKISELPAKYYAPGHGVIVRFSLSRLTYDYRQWCQQQKQQDFTVALLYASAYGNTAIIANAITQSLIDNGVAVELINCELETAERIVKAIKSCDGFIIGSPTLGGHAPVQIETALGIVLANAAKTKLAGVFGSYGWSGEAIDLIEEKLRDGNYRLGFETIRVRFTPTKSVLEQCQQAGLQFAQTLKKRQKQSIPRQGLTETQIDRTEQAVGRIIGSLSVLTTRNGDQDQGFLTGWVSQATFNPPGLMIAINKSLCCELEIDLNMPFVLNILKEGRNLRKHFSYHSHNSENAFSQLTTEIASNGCLIIKDALAYLECTVGQKIASGDHWLIYAIVNHGDVLEPDGVTAIHTRKSGRQY
jgi:flavorubredoxin/flavin reductase (DIM6/NTAB) family NADH-FMN oxidoreductase RutF